MSNDEYFGDSLFDSPRKRYRSEDPRTSRMAAESANPFLHKHHRKILIALDNEDGTPYEIAERSGLDPAAVFRRMNELEKMKKVFLTGEERRGDTGRLCRVWKKSD